MSTSRKRSNRGSSLHWSAANDRYLSKKLSKRQKVWKKKLIKAQQQRIVRVLKSQKKLNPRTIRFITGLLLWTDKSPLTYKQLEALKKFERNLKKPSIDENTKKESLTTPTVHIFLNPVKVPDDMNSLKYVGTKKAPH
jgi:hypothetical protein